MLASWKCFAYFTLFYGLLTTLSPQTPPGEIPPSDRSQRGQIIPADLSQWIALSPPRAHEEKWTAASHSPVTWEVCLQSGKPIARLYNEATEQRILLPFGFYPRIIGDTPEVDLYNKTTFPRKEMAILPDGWLLSFSDSSIYWFSPEGRQQEEVLNRPVTRFVSTKRFGLLGIPVQGLSESGLLQFVREQDHWVSQTFVALNEDPYLCQEDKDGSLLVLTDTQLLRIHPDKSVQPLLTDVFWNGLSPNSLLPLANGDIYVGMRHGVARLHHMSKDKYKVQWLLPNKAFVNMKDPLGDIKI